MACLRGNEKARETVLACSFGAKISVLISKRAGQKAREAVPLTQVFTLLPAVLSLEVRPIQSCDLMSR